MQSNQIYRFLCVFIGLLITCTTLLRADSKRPFTVADEIGVTLFSHDNSEEEEVKFSPDREYFAVWTERGRIDINQVEDSLRIYRSRDVEAFLEHHSELPQPFWVVDRTADSVDRTHAAISDWRWLKNSSGIVFLERNADKRRLVFGDVRKKKITPLTPLAQNITAFDIIDSEHFVYSALEQTIESTDGVVLGAPAVDLTGHSIEDALFQDDPAIRLTDYFHQSIWAVNGSKRVEVRDKGVPLNSWASLTNGIPELKLSPDARFIITAVRVSTVPESWDMLYPPPYSSYPSHFHPGAISEEYVLFDLQRNALEPVTGAPNAWDVGWLGTGPPSFSRDATAVLVPGTFVRNAGNLPSRPCVAVTNLVSHKSTCVQVLNGRSETGIEPAGVTGASFVGGDSRKVSVTFYQKSSTFTKLYEYRSEDKWEEVDASERDKDKEPLEIGVEEDINQAPKLVAKNNGKQATIWDPNPQLANLELGTARVYRWKDKDGKELRGGLYIPNSYDPARRYPLVIQTHGFRPAKFIPSGLYSTGNAARALAASGIIVLQMAEQDCPWMTTREGSCTVSRYQSAIDALASDGLIDPNKVGIVGFSHTCLNVMEMLTSGSSHIKAALITDGIVNSYMQYMLGVDDYDNGFADEIDQTIGARPFSDGLQTWLKRSPVFNINKVDAPLMIVGEGHFSTLSLWEPYAILRYLHKPVELVMLNSKEHILTNPATRLASQGGSVDWFRFWLQGYEDPDTGKSEQYKRWGNLRKLQK